MEKPGYRENYELLKELFPGKLAITVQEAARVMNSDIKTIYAAVRLVRNPLPAQKLCGKLVIPIPGFARWLSTRYSEI